MPPHSQYIEAKALILGCISARFPLYLNKFIDHLKASKQGHNMKTAKSLSTIAICLFASLTITHAAPDAPAKMAYGGTIQVEGKTINIAVPEDTVDIKTLSPAYGPAIESQQDAEMKVVALHIPAEDAEKVLALSEKYPLVPKAWIVLATDYIEAEGVRYPITPEMFGVLMYAQSLEPIGWTEEGKLEAEQACVKRIEQDFAQETDNTPIQCKYTLHEPVGDYVIGDGFISWMVIKDKEVTGIKSEDITKSFNAKTVTHRSLVLVDGVLVVATVGVDYHSEADFEWVKKEGPAWTQRILDANRRRGMETAFSGL